MIDQQPVKAKKIDLLEFIHDREAVTAGNLMEQFDYTYSGAHSRLSQLRKGGLVQGLTKGRWCLTEKAYKKLDYHGVLKRKEDEKERIKRQEEGKLWFIDGGRIRMARNVSEMLLTLDEAIRTTRELKKEGFL